MRTTHPARVVLAAALLAGCAGTTYVVDIASDTVPALRIVAVTNAKASTRVTLVYDAMDTGTRRLGVRAPGEPGAFVIRTPDGKRTYSLVAVEGVAILPARTTLFASQTLTFALTFERIPDDLRHFQLEEGESEGDTRWQFHDVCLR